jgi:hypothetical protein
MEVAGFAIGVVGLAGLYSTCIQLLGQIESSRTDYIARELHTLHARLCTTRHLLKEWGQAIGLDSNGIPNSEIHNPKLADAEKRKVRLGLLTMYLHSKGFSIGSLLYFGKRGALVREHGEAREVRACAKERLTRLKWHNRRGQHRNRQIYKECSEEDFSTSANRLGREG